ncbi:hypothetical protein OESDEN_03140, partial [Oesophagostomum dentatum]
NCSSLSFRGRAVQVDHKASSATRKNNIRQRFVTLLKKFKIPEEEGLPSRSTSAAMVPTDKELQDLFEELENMSDSGMLYLCHTYSSNASVDSRRRWQRDLHRSLSKLLATYSSILFELHGLLVYLILLKSRAHISPRLLRKATLAVFLMHPIFRSANAKLFLPFTIGILLLYFHYCR